MVQTGSHYKIMSDTKYNSADGPQPLTVEDASQTTVVNNVTTLQFPDGSITDGGSGQLNINQLPSGTGGIDGPNINSFDSKLTSVWTMNDAGAPIDDSLGGYDMTVNGVGFNYLESGADAKNSNSIEKTVATDYFTRAAGFGPTASEDFTINMWIKMDTSNPAGFTKLAVFVLSTSQFISMGLNASGTRIEIFDDNYSNAVPLLTSSTFTSIYDEAYHMVTLGRRSPSGLDREYFCFLDGSDKGTASYTVTPTDGSTAPLYFGYSPIIAGSGWTGHMDEIQFWKGTDAGLSVNAVSDLWNGGTGLFLS